MVDGNKRLAWLLATRRLLGSPRTASRSEFVSALRDAGVRADSSRISRWESGLEPLSTHLVQSYEQATGAPSYSLVALRKLLVRGGHLDARADTSAEPAGASPEHFDTMMDRVHSSSMRGDLWLDFTAALERFGHVYMHPRVWRATTDLLVDEMSRSLGHAYVRRYEAAVFLLAVPAVRPHLSRSIGQFTLEPGSQRVMRVLPVLGERPDQAVQDLLSKMLSTADPYLAGSAALIASSMIGKDFVTAATLHLEDHLARALRRRRGPLPPAAIDSACRLPLSSVRRVLHVVEDPSERQRLGRAWETKELVDGDAARSVSDHIAVRAERALGRQAEEPDLMLRALLRDAMFHVHHDRRWQASSLLLASPYAEATAAAALNAVGGWDRTIAGQAWSFVRRLATAVDPGALGEQVLAEERDALRGHALACLAGSRDALNPPVERYVAEIAHSHASDRGLALAAVSALGMHGRRALLDAVPAGPAAEAARWWRTTGGAIHET